MPPFHCLKDKIKNTKNHFYFKKVDVNIFFFKSWRDSSEITKKLKTMLDHLL